tara:strand:+ start:698 stop:928 length:231 start_codon:yes stop_codon:yes gene_type:complete
MTGPPNMKHILLAVILMSPTSLFAHDGPFYSVDHLDTILLLGFAAAVTLIGGYSFFDKSAMSISTRLAKIFTDKTL